MSTDIADIEAAIEATRPESPKVMLPEPDLVELPIGLATPTGVIDKVRVRELNGYDEEAIARSKSVGQMILTILERATVKIGSEDATPDLLREMFLGDRLAVLVGISRCTWGRNVVVNFECPECKQEDSADFDLDDLEYTKGHLEDSVFEVPLKKGAAKVHWPKGDVHEALLHMSEETSAAFRTVLINKCVVEINGLPVMGDVARKLTVPDRSTLNRAINDVYLGPRFDKTSVHCPNCGKEITPALVVGDLFPI